MNPMNNCLEINIIESQKKEPSKTFVSIYLELCTEKTKDDWEIKKVAFYKWKRTKYNVQENEKKFHNSQLLTDKEEKIIVGIVRYYSIQNKGLLPSEIVNLARVLLIQKKKRKKKNAILWNGSSWFKGFIFRQKEFLSKKVVVSKNLARKSNKNHSRFGRIF